MRMQGKTKCVLVLIMGILLIIQSSFATAQVQSLRDKLKPLVRQGCVLVADEQKVLFRYPRGCNPLLIPASLVKLATASMVFSVLGKEFRFPTDFFLSENGRGKRIPFEKLYVNVARILLSDIYVKPFATSSKVWVILLLKFVEIPLLNVVLIPIKGENDLDILENCK